MTFRGQSLECTKGENAAIFNSTFYLTFTSKTKYQVRQMHTNKLENF